MHRAGRIIRTILKGGLVAASVLIALLMVTDLYDPLHPEFFKAGSGDVVIPELTGLTPDALLNSGDLAALDELPGIGEVLAGRIIETRERDGMYYFAEDVMTVSGIGEKRFADIMAYIAAQEATPTDITAVP